MSNAMLRILACVLAASILCAGSTFAVSSAANNVVMPQHVLDAKKEISKNYGSSGIARRVAEAAAALRVDAAAGPAQPTAVTFSMPVLMGSYSDAAHISTASQFQAHLFGVNPTGSMTDYYNEVSYNNFTATGTVYGPYTAAQTQAYYVNGDNGFGNDFPTNASGFIYSVLAAADGGVNFANYDNDGPDGVPNSGDDDGFVDALAVIFPDGDASGGDSDNMWAHQWALQWGAGAPYTTNDAAAGGGFIQVNEYMIQAGEQGDGTWNVIKPVGVYCHEFGHVLGLPDLYDGDGSSYGVGTYALMGSGSWGANWNSTTEHHPTHMCAWSKEMMGWVTPIDVVGTQAVSIPPVETNAIVYRLWDDAYKGGRYFLLENRTQSGFDADIYGEGVLIWHCNSEIRYDNTVDAFRLMDLEEADGLNQIDSKASWMDPGDFWPGSTSASTFDDFSSPNAYGAYGGATGVSATSFAVGAGKNINVTLTQRVLSGYTLYYDTYAWMNGWGYSTAQINNGAARFVAPTAGTLVSVQAGCWGSNPVGYTVKIYDNMVAGSPVNLHSTTSGTFPSYPNDRYHEIPLSSSHILTPGQTFLVDVAFGPDVYAVPFSGQPPYSGQSFWSANGTTYNNWTDKDVMVRARISAIVDSDGDGIPDGSDNCPSTHNPSQADGDGDLVGDACDVCPGFNDYLDGDGDGVPDGCDICSGGDDTVDSDADGVPDFCDVCPGFDDNNDADGDGVPNGCDVCPGFDDGQDADGDGVPNGCDVCPGFDDSQDADGDGVPDGCDICSGGDDTVDSDADGVPDFCDVCPGSDDNNDADGDGVPNGCDVCPGFDDSQDADGDGVPDGCDICSGGDDTVDSDADGVPDFCDVCPGFDDSNDSDGDGVPTGCDNCPDTPNPDQLDSDGDTIGDACDFCCGYYDAENRAGNVDYDPVGVKDLTDILHLAAYAFLSGPVPPCMAEMNVDGDAGCVYDLTDVLNLASYAYLSGPKPAFCMPACE